LGTAPETTRAHPLSKRPDWQPGTGRNHSTSGQPGTGRNHSTSGLPGTGCNHLALGWPPRPTQGHRPPESPTLKGLNRIPTPGNPEPIVRRFSETEPCRKKAWEVLAHGPHR
jgi:hypothetical protein